jgi:hypothetical protein
MKRLVIVFFFTLLFVNIAQAQYREVYFGAKVGGNLSHVMFKGDAESVFNHNKMMLSSHIGAFAEIIFNDLFSVQPELLYSVKGAHFDLVGPKDPKSSYVLKYLSLPIVGKYYVSENFSIELGPQVAYLLSARNEEKSDEYQSNLGYELASVDVYDDMKALDYGVTAGIGYLTKTGFYISARYNIGLANTFKSQPDITNSLKNGAAQLSLGFSFQ